MSKPIQQELMALADDLRRGTTEQTIERLEGMATRLSLAKVWCS